MEDARCESEVSAAKKNTGRNTKTKKKGNTARVGCKHLEYAALYILYANLGVSFRVEVMYQ